MKLNYKRTFFVGFAFFLIMAFWQAYEAVVPLILVNKFGLGQTSSGIVMALDNVLAVFLLPLFGALSDKTRTKMGRRTPYILVGTVVAIAAFIGLSFADNAQLAKFENLENPTEFKQTLFDDYGDEKITNAEKLGSHIKGLEKEYSVQDYASMVKYNKPYDKLSKAEQDDVREWYKKLDTDDKNETNYYYYKIDGKAQSVVYSLEKEDDNYIKASSFNNLVSAARSRYAWAKTKENPVPLIFFMIILFILLLSMALFRTPAVALMPDVTIKPLRSQANAIINLMGTFGAIFVLILGIVFKTGKIAHQLDSFTWYIVAVCGIMAAGLTAFMCLVKEPKWSDEMEQKSRELGIDAEPEKEASSESAEDGGGAPSGDAVKKDRKKFVSLILILLSVALWYMGYNAATSKYSLYAMNVLHKDFNTTLLIAQAAAVVCYVPAGWLSSKIGRKKSILIGVTILAAAFIGISLFDMSTPAWLINVVFPLGGVGWATINVNSFPMVVELAKGGNVGKYTGYYYTASMTAQIITPILSGAIMDYFGSMDPLFPYCIIFVALSFVTMLFVRHGDNMAVKEEKSRLAAK